MKAYMVAAIFADGALCTQCMLADSPESATGRAAVMFLRVTKTESEMSGIVATEIPVAFLRAALQALELERPAGLVIFPAFRDRVPDTMEDGA